MWLHFGVTPRHDTRMMGLLQLCQTAGPAHVMDLLDWLVPPAALDDARLRTRHRGIAKALLTISLVVSIMLLAVAFVRGGMGVAFILFFLACIVTPLIGAASAVFMKVSRPSLPGRS